MLLTVWQGDCDEGVWVHHRTLTSQPHPAPNTLTHAPRTPDSPTHPLNPLPLRNRHSEAEPLLRQALEQRLRVLGPEHPDTISTIDILASCTDALGR